MRLIDADILEREGWYLSRNYVVDSKTRCFESKAIKKVPTAHPELNEWCHDCKEYDTEKGCCPRWGQVIKTALEDAKPEQRWIPCSERLPEDYEEVLVWFEYFRYGDYNRLYQTHGIGDYSSEYDSWMINHESGWSKLRVFAWMPLPEAYKGEKE